MVAILIFSILINHSYFQLNAFNPCNIVAVLILSILINLSYFQVSALKPGIYRFSGSASLLKMKLQLNTLTPRIQIGGIPYLF